jgi:hypothetical protein
MDEGVYAFGGKRQNGTSSGVMKLLKFGKYILLPIFEYFLIHS